MKAYFVQLKNELFILAEMVFIIKHDITILFPKYRQKQNIPSLITLITFGFIYKNDSRYYGKSNSCKRKNLKNLPQVILKRYNNKPSVQGGNK
jgi:hypothetical protein